jgi:hypothetical protein
MMMEILSFLHFFLCGKSFVTKFYVVSNFGLSDFTIYPRLKYVAFQMKNPSKWNVDFKLAFQKKWGDYIKILVSVRNCETEVSKIPASPHKYWTPPLPLNFKLWYKFPFRILKLTHYSIFTDFVVWWKFKNYHRHNIPNEIQKSICAILCDKCMKVQSWKFQWRNFNFFKFSDRMKMWTLSFFKDKSLYQHSTGDIRKCIWNWMISDYRDHCAYFGNT